MSSNLTVAVSAKIRIFDDLQHTINYAKMLESSGADFISVHGRTREEKSHGFARWNYIAAIR